MWFAVLKQELNSPQPLRETVSELRLMEPAWSSPIVHRESSVLLQMLPDGPLTARLAFPAAEILEIATANRAHRFDLTNDVKLSEDGLVLKVTKPGMIDPIKAADLFLLLFLNSYSSWPAPEQLPSWPGRWFHDRDIEITYRRREMPARPTRLRRPFAPPRRKAGKPICWASAATASQPA